MRGKPLVAVFSQPVLFDVPGRLGEAGKGRHFRQQRRRLGRPAAEHFQQAFEIDANPHEGRLRFARQPRPEPRRAFGMIEDKLGVLPMFRQRPEPGELLLGGNGREMPMPADRVIRTPGQLPMQFPEIFRRGTRFRGEQPG